MTKHIQDDALKCNLTIETAKIEIVPKIIDNSFIEGNPCLPKPRSNLNIRTVKNKVNTKRSKLEKATEQLYNIEEDNAPEKPLTVDFGLFQMEDY